MKKLHRHKWVIALTLFCLVGVVVVSCPDGGMFRPEEEIRPETLMDAVNGIPSVDSIAFEKVSYPYDGITLTETEFYCRGMINHMFILQVETGRHLTFRPSTPSGLPVSGERQTMPDQAAAAEEAGEQVLYAINADVFGAYREDLPGLPVPMGAVIIDGQPYQSFHHRHAENVFYVKKNGKPAIGTYAELESEPKKVRHAVGAWHTLVWDGVKASAPDDLLGMGFHPRTFIGITRDGGTVLIYVVDGRQEGWSAGLQMQDMIDICAATGCYRAVNFDGGGSTTLVARNPEGFAVLNRPSDEGRAPRPVVDGLLIVEEK